MIVYAAVAVLSVITTVYAGAHWSYHGHLPPNLWSKKYPDCGGKHQSPIDIDTGKVIVNKKLKPFNFSGLKKIDNLRLLLENNGHTAKVEIGNTSPGIINVRGGDLKGPYIVQQFHFHWGSNDSHGSEHSINGHHYPMEMHVVTYSSKYSKFHDAYKKTPSGLAVLAFMFQIGQENPAFQEIIKHMHNIVYKDEAAYITSFSLAALFPKDSYVYYTYPGSLTTPGCFESVDWNVFMNPITISERQINEYRKLCEEQAQGSHHLLNNYRPTQNMNGRFVQTNDPKGHYTPANVKDSGKKSTCHDKNKPKHETHHQQHAKTKSAAKQSTEHAQPKPGSHKTEAKKSSKNSKQKLTRANHHTKAKPEAKGTKTYPNAKDTNTKPNTSKNKIKPNAKKTETKPNTSKNKIKPNAMETETKPNTSKHKIKPNAKETETKPNAKNTKPKSDHTENKQDKTKDQDTEKTSSANLNNDKRWTYVLALLKKLNRGNPGNK